MPCLNSTAWIAATLTVFIANSKTSLRKTVLPLDDCLTMSARLTIYEATDYPVASAGDAGNMEAVATAPYAKYQNAIIVICGDDD
jgi:hypothetical protein